MDLAESTPPVTVSMSPVGRTAFAALETALDASSIRSRCRTRDAGGPRAVASSSSGMRDTSASRGSSACSAEQPQLHGPLLPGQRWSRLGPCAAAPCPAATRASFRASGEVFFASHSAHPQSPPSQDSGPPIWRSTSRPLGPGGPRAGSRATSRPCPGTRSSRLASGSTGRAAPRSGFDRVAAAELERGGGRRRRGRTARRQAGRGLALARLADRLIERRVGFVKRFQLDGDGLRCAQRVGRDVGARRAPASPARALRRAPAHRASSRGRRRPGASTCATPSGRTRGCRRRPRGGPSPRAACRGPA